jgi:hypothetical protein
MQPVQESSTRTNNLEIYFDESLHFKLKKNKSVKWLEFKKYLIKKYITLSEVKNKRIYIQTLSVASVKSNINKLCKRIFKSRHSGYEKFLSDDEKRLLYNVLLDRHRVVEAGI